MDLIFLYKQTLDFIILIKAKKAQAILMEYE